MRRKFIAGNWKMYKTSREALEFATKFKEIYMGSQAIVAIIAPFTQLVTLKQAFMGTGICIGAQNMHFADEGAYTGEISASMLREIDVDYVVIGHSERRTYYAETNETVNAKMVKALSSGLLPIMCVGENLAQREAGEEKNVIKEQLLKGLEIISGPDMEKVTIAYEPVWAIGTGKTATPVQAQEMCGFIRSSIAQIYGSEVADKVMIQYGGSVKPANAAELMNMPDIDGALVGGASLDPEDFLKIVNY